MQAPILLILLNNKFPIEVHEIKHYDLVDIISIFGSYLSVINLLFITIPVVFLSKKEFIKHMAKFLHNKEKYKHQEEKDIEKLYLKRVSHEGLFLLYDKVEEENSKQNEKI